MAVLHVGLREGLGWSPVLPAIDADLADAPRVVGAPLAATVLVCVCGGSASHRPSLCLTDEGAGGGTPHLAVMRVLALEEAMAATTSAARVRVRR